MSDRRLWFVLLAAVLAGLTYLPTLHYGFVWDDVALVAENQDLNLHNPLSLFGRSFMHHQARQKLSPDEYYRPMVVASLWLDHWMWRANPAGFHLTNVLLNMAAAAMAALALWRLLRGSTMRFWAASLGSLAFALHPAHVDSVAFVSGRTDILSAAFLLVSFVAVDHWLERRRWWLLPVAMLALAASLLSKETAVLLPLLVLVLPRRLRRTVVPLVCLASVVLLYLVARTFVLSGYLPAYSGAAAGTRLMLFLNSLGRYSVLALLPFSRDMLFADRTAFAAFGWASVAGVAALIGLPVVAWWRRGRPTGIGAMWFLVFVLPACNLFPVGLSYFAQRLLYLPSFGAVLAVAGAVVVLATTQRARRVATVAVAAYTGLFGIGTLAAMPAWQNQVSLFKVMARSGSPDAINNLGVAYQDANDLAAAETEFNRAIALQPGLASAHRNLASVLKARGDARGAVVEYRRALEFDPRNVEALNNLGVLYGRQSMFDSSLVCFRAALALDSGRVESWVNYGNALAMTDRPDSAETAFRRALAIAPGNADARANLDRLNRWRGRE